MGPPAGAQHQLRGPAARRRSRAAAPRSDAPAAGHPNKPIAPKLVHRSADALTAICWVPTLRGGALCRSATATVAHQRQCAQSPPFAGGLCVGQRRRQLRTNGSALRALPSRGGSVSVSDGDSCAPTAMRSEPSLRGGALCRLDLLGGCWAIVFSPHTAAATARARRASSWRGFRCRGWCSWAWPTCRIDRCRRGCTPRLRRCRRCPSRRRRSSLRGCRLRCTFRRW